MIAIVQGGLIRVVIPKLGQSKSLFTGLVMYTIGMVCFAFAGSTAFMFASCFVYCLGGIAGPAIQSIITAQVPANEQGELQGGLTSIISLTNIIGPVLMTSLFSFFTLPSAPIHFPGAAFFLGGIFMAVSLWIAYQVLNSIKTIT
jgi:DHA1 family tetracycline resistance protein-like MFS transporter